MKNYLGAYLLLVGFLGACGPAVPSASTDVPTSQSAAASTAAAARLPILYVGDSIAANTLNSVAWWTQITGKAQVSSSIFPGLAICDFLEGKPAGMPLDMKLRAQVRKVRPALVILQFWGNSFTPCMNGSPFATEAYYTTYFWDALNAVNQIEAGARDVGIPRPKILWVLQGPDKGLPQRTHRLNDIYSYVAGLRGDRTSDAGWGVSLAANPYGGKPSERYTWTQWLPCNSIERGTPLCTNPVAYGGVAEIHKDTDAVHFCLGNATYFFGCDKPSPGINRYGMRIAYDANKWLGI